MTPEIIYEITWQWPGRNDTRIALATHRAAEEIISSLRDNGFVNITKRPKEHVNRDVVMTSKELLMTVDQGAKIVSRLGNEPVAYAPKYKGDPKPWAICTADGVQSPFYVFAKDCKPVTENGNPWVVVGHVHRVSRKRG